MFPAIDVAKFIFSVFVIGIHTRPLENATGELSKELTNFLFNLGVPFFFISSGFFLFSKPAHDTKEQHKIIKNYALRLSKLYLIWTAIYIPITLYDAFENGKGFVFNFVNFFRLLVLVGEHFYSWPLWYLLASIYGILAFKPFIARRHLLPLAALVLLIVSQFLTQFARGEIDFLNHAERAKLILKSTISNGRILSGLPYLAIGYYMSKPFSRQIHIAIYGAGLVGLMIFFLKIPFAPSFSTPLVCAAVFLAAKSVKINPSDIFLKLRRASTVMYFSHMLFYFMISLIANDFRWFGWTPFACVTCLSIMSSCIVIKYENKTRALKYIFG